jgi:hypothetical protein
MKQVIRLECLAPSSRDYLSPRQDGADEARLPAVGPTCGTTANVLVADLDPMFGEQFLDRSVAQGVQRELGCPTLDN